MKVKRPKQYAHWAYRDTESKGHIAEVRRQVEEADTPGWRDVAKRGEGNLMPHKIMAFDEEVSFRGRTYRVLFLEAWYFTDKNWKHLFMVDKLFAEMEEIESETDYDIHNIVLRLNWGIDRTEEELEQCKKWLLEYQAANDMSLKDLDTFCAESPEWIFEQIFG